MDTIFALNHSIPLCTVPIMKKGNQPTDGGHFLMMDDEKRAFLKKEPQAEKFIKPFINTKEYLYGQKKWVLWLKHTDSNEYSHLPTVMERIKNIKELQAKSSSLSTRRYPYHHLMQPTSDYLLVPSITSENHDYIPIGFFTSDIIVGNKCHTIPGANILHLGILQSKMHMVWMKTVCGRLKSDYNYSSEIVYNNFPWPEEVSEEQKNKIEAATQKILDAHTAWPDSTLARLYNPLTMPENLLHAHQHLDTLIDRTYRK